MTHIGLPNGAESADKVRPVPHNAAHCIQSPAMIRSATHLKRSATLLGGLVLSVCMTAAASPVSASDFDGVWRQAAKVSGIPVRVLHGIALVESGRQWSDGTVRAWPWTLNSPSTGSKFFPSREKAEQALRQLLAQGEKNIDIGLMQVNCGYHCSRVQDPTELLDPAINIRVAAEILLEYRGRKGGNVAATVGAYHAGLHPDRAARSQWYQNAVATRVRRLGAGGPA